MTTPTLRWEGPNGRTWDGYSGKALVAVMVEPSAGYAYRWYLCADGRTSPFMEEATLEAARAAAEAAWAEWCATAGLMPVLAGNAP